MLKFPARIAVLCLSLVSGVAVAQDRKFTVEYEDAVRIAQSESPVSVKVAGWGDTWAETIWKAKAKGSEYRDLYYVASLINRGGYVGELLFSVVNPGSYFQDDSLRARVQRHRVFSKTEIEFGDYDTVDNGAAEYRYILFTSKDSKQTRSCTYFQANWRNYISSGSLCTNGTLPPLTKATVSGFIKSIGFLNELEPEGEAVLPTS